MISPCPKRVNAPSSRHVAVMMLLAAMSALFSAQAASAAAVTMAEAIQQTLSRELGIQVSKQTVIQNRGYLQSASGLFDWTLASQWSGEVDRQPTGLPSPLLAVRRENTGTYSVGMSKLFKSGISLTPSVGVVDYRNNYDQLAPVSSSNLSVELHMPLLRNFGRESTTAQERYAKLGLQAQELQTRFDIDKALYQAAESFWTCLYSERDLEIVADTEKRAQNIFDIVKSLVDIGDLDRGTLAQAEARIAVQKAERRAAELNLFQARQNLGKAMGFTPRELVDPPTAGDVFPTPSETYHQELAFREKLVSEALARRYDYLAAGVLVSAQEVLLSKASDNLRPKLDATVKLGYAGIDGSSSHSRPLNALGMDLTGVNAMTTFSLEWPTSNNAARGTYLSQKAAVQKARLNAQLAATDVASSVLSAAEALQSAALQYGLSTQAVDNYRRATAQVFDKLRINEASLTDLIELEEHYLSARQTQNAVLSHYAITLAQLRLMTGTLTMEQEHQAVLPLDNLRSLPFPRTNP